MKPKGSGNFRGDLVKVRIWPVPRSEQQIRKKLKHRLTGSERGLAAYFPMNEQMGRVVRDLTGYTFGGAITGAEPDWRPDPTTIQ